MLSIVAFIMTIGVVVTIHEFGHFIVARWCGVRVLRFSIGFGKPLIIKTLGKDQTEFVLAAIPLGGFVKMLDENELKAEREIQAEAQAILSEQQPFYAEAELKRAFNRQSVFKRIAIVLAGPLANLLLAILLYWLLLLQGETGMRPVIGDIKEGGLAAAANFIKGEEIQKIAGQPINTWQDARLALLEASFNTKTVDIETVISNELHQHTLSFNGINNDTEVDILNKIGMQAFMPNVAAVIGQILPNSAAKKAGLKVNDEILRINSLPINHWDEVVNQIKASPSKALQLEIKRQQQQLKITITPDQVKENNQWVGKVGAGAKVNQKEIDKLLIEQHYSLTSGFKKAISKTWETSVLSLKLMWYMVSGKISWKGISGPVTIAKYAGESASFGLKTFVAFIAFISISVGVLNLLPIPMLDGGHFMYYIAEVLKGSPVSEQVMLAGQKVGFGLLGLLMTLAIFNDINRLFASA